MVQNLMFNKVKVPTVAFNIFDDSKLAPLENQNKLKSFEVVQEIWNYLKDKQVPESFSPPPCIRLVQSSMESTFAMSQMHFTQLNLSLNRQ